MSFLTESLFSRAAMKKRIIQNTEMCSGIFLMKMERGGMPRAVPGQFVHVRCSELLDPLLRRPFSILDMDDDSFEIIYKVVGKGTSILSEKKPGSSVDVIGPLGNGFKIADDGRKVIIAAGGMGIAPTLFLARSLPGRVHKFITGARTKKLLLCSERLSGVDAVTVTDDGSCGVKGNAACVVSSVLTGAPDAVVCACGPLEMLRAVHSAAKVFKVSSQMCFEKTMACGVGVCLGCALKVFENGLPVYKRVCRDGPVFKGESIVWESLI